MLKVFWNSARSVRRTSEFLLRWFVLGLDDAPSFCNNHHPPASCKSRVQLALSLCYPVVLSVCRSRLPIPRDTKQYTNHPPIPATPHPTTRHPSKSLPPIHLSLCVQLSGELLCSIALRGVIVVVVHRLQGLAVTRILHPLPLPLHCCPVLLSSMPF